MDGRNGLGAWQAGARSRLGHNWATGVCRSAMDHATSVSSDTAFEEISRPLSPRVYRLWREAPTGTMGLSLRALGNEKPVGSRTGAVFR